MKHFHHSIVGDLDLLFESTNLEADPGMEASDLHGGTRLPHRGRSPALSQLGSDAGAGDCADSAQLHDHERRLTPAGDHAKEHNATRNHQANQLLRKMTNH